MRYFREPSGGHFGHGYLFKCAHCNERLQINPEDSTKLIHPNLVDGLFGNNPCQYVGRNVPNPDVFECPDPLPPLPADCQSAPINTARDPRYCKHDIAVAFCPVCSPYGGKKP